jgi:hypothetical protein
MLTPFLTYILYVTRHVTQSCHAQLRRLAPSVHIQLLTDTFLFLLPLNISVLRSPHRTQTTSRLGCPGSAAKVGPHRGDNGTKYISMTLRLGAGRWRLSLSVSRNGGEGKHLEDERYRLVLLEHPERGQHPRMTGSGWGEPTADA